MAVSSSPDHTREGLTCPNHPGHRLHTVHTEGGVAVKQCDLCGGVWLDRGQIYQLADAPSRVVTALRSALDQQISTDRPSPRTGTTMTRLTLGDDLDLYRCRDTGGLWLDAETVARIDPAIHHFRIAFGPKTRRLPRGPLAVLPNLILRSGMVLAYLYLLVFLVLYGAGHFIPGVSAEDVMAVAAGGLVLQFLLGLYILDLVLRWFYSMRWVDPRKADRDWPMPSTGSVRPMISSSPNSGSSTMAPRRLLPMAAIPAMHGWWCRAACLRSLMQTRSRRWSRMRSGMWCIGTWR